MIWRPTSPAASAALARELALWSGTPYAEGQRAVGAGVDCIRFVGAVLDAVRGRAPTPVRALRRGAAHHDQAAAHALMADLVEVFQPVAAVRDGTLEPGDVVVLGFNGSGPMHVMIAGPARWSLWEAAPPNGVGARSRARLTAADAQVHRVWRPLDKAVWR